MSTDLSQHNGKTQAADPAEIERDIARQRAELAATVDALSHKLDVKARAQEAARHKADTIRDSTTTDTGRPRPELVVAAATALAAAAALVWWRTRH